MEHKIKIMCLDWQKCGGEVVQIKTQNIKKSTVNKKKQF